MARLLPVAAIADMVASEVWTPGVDGYAGLVGRLVMLVPFTGAILLGARLTTADRPASADADADPNIEAR